MNKLARFLIKNLPLVLFFPLVLMFLMQGCKQDSAQWRGENRNGIYDEINLLETWPNEGPELVWFAEGIGKGYASPAVASDKLFVNGEIDSISHLFAYDLKGNLLWKTPNGPEFMGSGFSSTYPGARSTPTVRGNLVYTTSGMGRIACIESSTGSEKWAVDLIKDLDGTNNYFGYSESVIVDEKNVYCNPGGDKINMAALDRKTGEVVWTTEALKDTFSYCSPILVTLPERKVIITTSRHNLFAVDTKNGELLGSYKLEGYEYDGEHCNSPVYEDGYIYFIANDDKGRGAVKLEISPDGKNIKEIWSNDKIRNNFHGYVLVEDKLFTTVQGNWLKVLAPQNGTVTDSIKVANGSIIFADNKFICYGTNGSVNLIDYNQGKLKVSGKLEIDKGSGQHFSHPVIADGIMYIRHGDALTAYKIN